MLKMPSSKAAASEGSKEVQTALRVGRSLPKWVLANGKALPAIPTSENLSPYVEGLNDARTLHGERRVSARRGWAGEKRNFFSILLGFLPEEERTVQPGDGDGHEFDRQEQSAYDGIGCRWV